MGPGSALASLCRQLSFALSWQAWAGGQTKHCYGIPMGVVVPWSAAVSHQLQPGQMLDFLPGWRGNAGDYAGLSLCSCWRQCPALSQLLLLCDAAFLAILLGHRLAPE